MDFLEKDLEEIIFTADRNDLAERGLSINGKLFRQFRIGTYGVADIIEFDKTYHEGALANGRHIPFIDINIYELKQNKVGISAFLQAIRYARGIHRYMTNVKSFNCDNFQITINLIGRKVDNSDFIYLPDLIPVHEIDASNFLNIYTYSYDLNGIKFRLENGFYLIDEGF